MFNIIFTHRPTAFLLNLYGRCKLEDENMSWGFRMRPLTKYVHNGCAQSAARVHCCPNVIESRPSNVRFCFVVDCVYKSV